MKLNIGCKRGKLPDSVNIDVIKTSTTDKVIPWKEIDRHFNNQTIDHINIDRYSICRIASTEIDQILVKWFNLLRDGGMITVNVNDYVEVCKQIAQTESNVKLKEKLFGFVAGAMDFTHRAGYSAEELKDKLTRVGFTDIDINKVDDTQRVLTGYRKAKNAVAKKNVDYVKPGTYANYTGYRVYGLQRSGTNFLQRLMQSNLKIKFEKGQWKHSKVVDQLPTHSLHFYIYKTPYKWIDSVARNHEDVPKRWGNDYKLTQDGIMINASHRGRGKDITKLNVANLTKLYNDHITWWMTRGVGNIVYISYEDFIDSTAEKFVSLAEQQKLQLSRPPQNVVIVNKVPQSETFNESKREFYLSPNKFDYLTQEHIECINKHLDPQVIKLINLNLL